MKPAEVTRQEQADQEAAEEQRGDVARDAQAEIADAATAEKVRIQYGGSVKPGNTHDLMKQPDIDGALVGGASLVARDWDSPLAAGSRKHTAAKFEFTASWARVPLSKYGSRCLKSSDAVASAAASHLQVFFMSAGYFPE